MSKTRTRNQQPKKKKGCFGTIVKAAIIGVVILVASFIAIIQIHEGDSPSEPTVVNNEFKNANKKIDTKKDGTYWGNNEVSKDMAKEFSDGIFALQKEFFSGGKEKRIVSMTGEQFLTYCQISEKKVCFLVHVPQFKRYKGEVRDSLLTLGWTIASKVASSFPENTKIAVCMRGSITYGGIVHGKLGSEPQYINKFSILEKELYPHFD